MIESQISLALCCCSTGPSILDVFTNLALLFDRSPILIIAAIVAILQVVLIILHKVNICGKILTGRKKEERNVSSDRQTDENIKLR